ncbi:MAG: Mov34/MPN/PAD-1 family protein [Methanobacteriaceae archaeon]
MSFDLDKFITKILGNDKKEFSNFKVDAEVIDNIVGLAIESDPNEFMTMLDGEIKNNTLFITGLIFIPIESSDEGAVINTWMIPPSMSTLGSVHSHPGPSALPSNTDLATFSKMGLFHMIICRPYDINSIMAYNRFGEPVRFEII